MLRGVEDQAFAVAARAAIFGLLALSLGSCSALDKALSVTDTDDASDSVTSADLTARNPAPLDNRLRDPLPPKGEIFGGGGGDSEADVSRLLNPPPAAPGEEAVARGADSYDLNFQNADINAVTKVLLGDILKVTYSVDPRVQGTLSLSSGRPVPKASIMTLYESAVKIVNANVVREGGIYKIVPIGEALGNGEIDRANLTAGYGITVMPLHYVSAKTIMQALDSFATKPGMIRVDSARNILLVQGPSTERASAIEAALALDVDWMKNQSVGVFPVRNASPETIIKELGEVFDAGKEGAGGGLVRFQPINRLNAVLAIGQSDHLIRQVKTWIARLDRADYDNTAVRVYKLRYGNAKIIAAILKDVFTGQSGGLGGVGNADLSQLTPGTSLQRGTSGATRTGRGTNSTTDQGLGTGTGGTTSVFGNQDDTSGSRDSAGGGSVRRSVDIAGLSTSSGQSGPAPLPNVRITADVVNNSLLIYASRDQYKMVERAIFELDKAPLQVAIDVTVAEVTLNNQLQYGVQYFLHDKGNGSSLSGGMFTLGAKAVATRVVPGANLVLGGKDPAVILSALKAITDVKVLSAPAVVVLDNQQATLQVGDQVPVITQQASSVTTADPAILSNVERHDTGVILKVIPRVNANGVVHLDVSQEVSAVAPGPADPTLGPTISQRKIQSSIAVTSGQTVLLGGLISAKTDTSRSGIPILMDIKGVGDLFATTDKKADRTELIIFIRPQIIRSGSDAQLVAEELRSKLSTLGRGMPVGARPVGPRSRDAR